MSQNVSELLGASMAKVREMVDANTVVGTPISAGDDTTLIPISKISFAMASGGSDLKPKAGCLCAPVRRRRRLRREDRPRRFSGAAGRAGAYAPDH